MVLGFAANHVVKVILLVLLGLFGLAFWLLPGTRFAKRPPSTERLFVATSVVGTICGGLALAVSVAWPARTLEWHLWELLLMPLVAMLTFWLVLARRSREPLLDELQVQVMADAGGAAIGASILASLIALMWPRGGSLDASILHPVNLSAIVFAYSLFVRLRFKRG